VLFLIGFMAAGKTSVGRAIAAQTHRRFVDLDDEIAALGEPVATLVARDEPEFRRREAAALARLATGSDMPGLVVATGGGAAAHGTNLEVMRSAGLVVALNVDLAEARRRAAGGPARPLLANGEALAAARAPVYRRAHAVVETTGRELDDVVRDIRAIERCAATHPDATYLALGERTYAVTVGAALPAALPPRTALVTDTNVWRHWRASAPPAEVVLEIPPGEASKSLDTYRHVCETLVGHRVDRGWTIAALGGGVVGDLAGFVAATLYRGLPVIQLPTTLVAMTDAAIGGKTAVDLPAGKNLVGAFHQPSLVACATDTLATLPDRERRAGFGELWKYALLDGEGLWQLVDACAAWAAHGGPPPGELGEVLRRSIAYKAAVVGRDERERSGHRVLLNLGHTVGHAIETASGMPHGEAVGLGLVAACRVSQALGLLPDATLEGRVGEALRRSGLPADVEPWCTEEVLAIMDVDKKRVGGRVRYVALRGVGACEPVEIAVTDVRRILRPSNRP
jgi:shikimate kinase/3-dehydroquinate synthase